MSIAGKIDQLLNEKNYASFKDLRQHLDENKVKLQMFQYGIKHPRNLICSIVAENKNSKQIVAGTIKMSQVLSIDKSNKFEINSLVPVAILAQDYDVQKFMEFQFQEQLISKNGTMKYKKPLLLPSFQVQKKSTKTVASKKNDGKNKLPTTNVNNVKKTNTKQNIQKSKQVPIQVQKQKQSKSEVLITKQAKNKIKITKQEDSFEEQIKKFQILPNTQAQQKQIIKQFKEQVKQPLKIQEEKKQMHIEAKVADLDIDDDDLEAYEKMLQNKKKPQNVNINLPNKTQKRTTQKVIPPVQKQKPNNVNMQAKGTLFSFNFKVKK